MSDTDTDTFKCDLCNYETHRKYNLTRHKATKHAEVRISRQDENPGMVDAEAITDNTLAQPTNAPLTCPHCDRVFKNRSGMANHVKKCAANNVQIAEENVVISANVAQTSQDDEEECNCRECRKTRAAIDAMTTDVTAYLCRYMPILMGDDPDFIEVYGKYVSLQKKLCKNSMISPEDDVECNCRECTQTRAAIQATERSSEMRAYIVKCIAIFKRDDPVFSEMYALYQQFVKTN